MQQNPKSASRLLAIQSYYSQLIDNSQTKENSFKAASDNLEDEKIKAKKIFAEELYNFALAEKESIEFIINKYATDKNKDSEHMNPLLLAITTVALAELLKDNKTDRPIIISEYLKIGSEFFGKQETAFINAVLDKFVKENTI